MRKSDIIFNMGSSIIFDLFTTLKNNFTVWFTLALLSIVS